MGKIMTNYELIDRMMELYNEPNYYGSGGSNWSSWVDGGWYVDCTCSIKAILWGGRFIPANRPYPHAGCNYGSNGVPDFTPDSCVEWTNATRGHFEDLVPGEILLMTSHGHAGIYAGNGNVIEVTPAWTGGYPGCQISQIGINGERIKDGRQCLSWEWHGKIPVVDYKDSPKPSKKVNVYYRVKTKDYGWLSEVKNLDDYAGWQGSPITAIAIRVDKGSISYKAHIKGGEWLPSVTGYNINDFNNGYAGDGREIDCIQVYYYTPEDLVYTSGYKKAKYKVNNYDWQYDDETSNGQDGYAGVYGVNATEFRMVIE